MRAASNPGAKLVPPVHAFDATALGAYIHRHVDPFGGELEVEQFQGGQSNPTYRVTAGDRRYILRRKPPGNLLPSAHAVDREYRVMSALAATDVPVARMLALCEDASVIGTAFYVMAHVPRHHPRRHRKVLVVRAGIARTRRVSRSEIYHSISDIPARWFATLAITNSRSDNRLRYTMTIGSTAAAQARRPCAQRGGRPSAPDAAALQTMIRREG